MAATDFESRPRFFKVYISHLSSDSMMIPISYYEQLPSRLPKNMILQGPSGGSWNVSTEIRGDEVHFVEGWVKFVEDNTLSDGEFLTFVYNGNNIFEVSIFRTDGCKETSEAIKLEEDKEDSVLSLSSDDSSDKGKLKVEVVEDSDESMNSSVYSESSEENKTDTDTDSDFTIAKTIPKRMNKGKKKEEALEESSDEDDDSDSNYIEMFDQLDLEETATSVKPKVPNPKRIEAAKKKKKVAPRIKNPETYLDDRKNIYFETNVKNRLYELLIPAQLVKDYKLTFGDYVHYIDNNGKLRARVPPWKDRRVCVKTWKRICKRNKLKNEDRVLCELLRRGSYVYAIKLHVIRGRNL